MLGTIRFCLALCVVAFHLTATIPNLGLLAVNFFYVISGFLISLVLHETYRFRLAPFAANRFLRLYPAFYALAAVSLALKLAFPEYAKFHSSWATAPTAESVAGNLLMFPWAFFADNVVPVNFLQVASLQSATPHLRLIPSTWSIGVEIVCYFLLWLFTARSLWTAALTIALGVAWQWHVIASGLNPLLNYFPVTAAMLPFGFGALAYHLTRRWRIAALTEATARWVTIAVAVAFFANWKHSASTAQFVGSASYYANTVIAFVAVLLINKSRQGGRVGRLDKWLGDLSYPVFLGQYVFGFVAWEILGTGSPTRGEAVFALGTLITVAASALVVVLVDQRLVESRRRVREAVPVPAPAT